MATIRYSRERAENKKRFSSKRYQDIETKDTQTMELEVESSRHDIQMIARQGRNVGEVETSKEYKYVDGTTTLIITDTFGKLTFNLDENGTTISGNAYSIYSPHENIIVYILAYDKNGNTKYLRADIDTAEETTITITTEKDMTKTGSVIVTYIKDGESKVETVLLHDAIAFGPVLEYTIDSVEIQTGTTAIDITQYTDKCKFSYAGQALELMGIVYKLYDNKIYNITTTDGSAMALQNATDLLFIISYGGTPYICVLLSRDGQTIYVQGQIISYTGLDNIVVQGQEMWCTYTVSAVKDFRGVYNISYYKTDKTYTPTSVTKFNISGDTITSVAETLTGTVMLPSSYAIRTVDTQIVGARITYSNLNSYFNEGYYHADGAGQYSVELHLIWDGVAKTVSFTDEGELGSKYGYNGSEEWLYGNDAYENSEIYVTSLYCQVPEYESAFVNFLEFPILVNGSVYSTQEELNDACYSFDEELDTWVWTLPDTITFSGTGQVEEIIDGSTHELKQLIVQTDNGLNNIDYLVIPENYTNVVLNIYNNSITFSGLELQPTTPPLAGGSTLNNLKNSTAVKAIVVPKSAFETYEASNWNNTGKLISK